MILFLPPIRQEILIHLPELRLTAEQVGQVFKHVHIIQLAAFYDRVDDSPSPCAGMIAKEEIVVHTELAWTHGTLGCIIIRLKETVIEQARQGMELPIGIRHRFPDKALFGNVGIGDVVVKPFLEFSEYRGCKADSIVPYFVRDELHFPEEFFQPVNLIYQTERKIRKSRIAIPAFDELSPYVAQAGKPFYLVPFILPYRPVSGIPVRLDCPDISFQYIADDVLASGAVFVGEERQLVLCVYQPPHIFLFDVMHIFVYYCIFRGIPVHFLAAY